MALLIFVALLTLGLRILDEASDAPVRVALPHVRTMAFVSLASTFVTITWGGLVAGLKAGLVCDTFPLMHGSFVPSGMFTLTPTIANFFNHGLAVQFVHRTLAYVTAMVVMRPPW